MLKFIDFKNNIQAVIDYLNREYFSDSTVTMMTDEYLKQSIKDRLLQVVFQSEGIVSLNKDTTALSKAMLRSSLSEEDINFILNASLKISGLTVSIKHAEDTETSEETSGEPNQEKKSSEEETPENVNAMIKAKMETMGSLEILIGVIEDNLGTSRVQSFPSIESQLAAASVAGNVAPPIDDMLYIERPLEFNLDYLDLDKLDNEAIFQFLSSLMSSDSNTTLGIKFPIKALSESIIEFFDKDLEPAITAAISFARTSSKNSVTFVAEPDPFKTLFDTL